MSGCVLFQKVIKRLHHAFSAELLNGVRRFVLNFIFTLSKKDAYLSICSAFHFIEATEPCSALHQQTQLSL